ncbi:hypothetical protein BN873_210177 [Candidatus Competibacter denitrificans Run_A_D11]|uniref:Uncharacterized protein n=1 Tax=Candidatus Competibacter denitrificans Run_A_D11 TaxID=1400863 RepID=W6M314_9GAMM|nr:hypothetical protein BN873_210177 [Candidatus Competibacter denitrificans Run_A_D11]
MHQRELRNHYLIINFALQQKRIYAVI